MTNLEGRVILRRRAVDPPDGVRTDIDILCALAARLGQRHQFAFDGRATVFDELRRATAGGAGRLLRHHLRAHRGARTACSGRARPTDHPGTPRLFAERFPDAERPRAVPRRRPPVAGRGAATPSIPLLPDDRPRAARITSRARRRGASRSCTTLRPEPFAEMHPATARRAGTRRRRARDAHDARAARPTFTLQADARRSARTRCSCRSTGAARSRSTA